MNHELHPGKGRMKRCLEMHLEKNIWERECRGKLKNERRGHQHGSRLDPACSKRVRCCVGLSRKEIFACGAFDLPESGTGESTAFVFSCCQVSENPTRQTLGCLECLRYARVGCLVWIVLTCLLLNYKAPNSKQARFLPQRCIELELVRRIKSLTRLWTGGKL